MTEDQEERLLQAVEKIADALAGRTQIEASRFGKDFPQQKVKREAKVFRNDDDRREQFSDRASDEWVRDTEQAIPESVSRFEQRFKSEATKEPAKK